MTTILDAAGLTGLLTDRIPRDAVDFDFISARGLAWLARSGWEMHYVALRADGTACAGVREVERHPRAESQNPAQRVWETLNDYGIGPDIDLAAVIDDLESRGPDPVSAKKRGLFCGEFAGKIDWRVFAALSRGGRHHEAEDYSWVASDPDGRMRFAVDFPWAVDLVKQADFLGLIDPASQAPASEIVTDAVMAVGEARGFPLDKAKIRQFVAAAQGDPLPEFTGRIEQFRDPPTLFSATH